MAVPQTDDTLLETPLAQRHRALGARMVPFAGYAMPVQYEGILAEHMHTRSAAGLFDVSHMGQGALIGPDHATTAAALEPLVPSDILGLAPGQQRYTVLLNEAGGIIDDLMVSRPAEPGLDGRLDLVVNAARKAVDWQHIAAALPAAVRLERADDMALLALQGPAAERVLARFCPEAAGMAFMTRHALAFRGVPVAVSRSGYTGEDGYEISVPAGAAAALWDALIGEAEVKPVGLGARDTLRLEAGLCLYGHDIDETTNPVEAEIGFILSRRRREAADFPGAARILAERESGPARRRVGLRLEGRAPAREGAEIATKGGEVVGRVTSGGFGPTVGAAIAMGYVAAAHAAAGTALDLIVRGRPLAATVVPLPFVPHRYRR